jgi:hypothetical protein
MIMNNYKICVQRFLIGVTLILLAFLASTAAWGSNIGPDTFGYQATDDTPYSFVDIASTGAAVLGGADDDKVSVNIGFTFSFYGKEYSSVCVSSNGLLSFGGCNPLDFANQDLSGSATAGDFPTIAPLWFDLTFAARGAGSVHYQTLGQPGSRRFVVQWQNAYVLNGSKGLTFQTILQEANAGILLQYLDIDAGAGSKASFGGAATIGIRDTAGQTSGRVLQWSYKVPVLRNGQAILFSGCASDVTSRLSVTRGGYQLNRTTNRYVQSVTIKNTSANPISGPVSLILQSLSSNATLFNKNGVTSCSPPSGSPYINVSVGSDGILSPGESASVTLEFTNPSNKSITYTARVLAGAGSR